MTIKEIVRAKLIEIGVEGLRDYDCGCNLFDWMPCGYPDSDCVPAKAARDEAGELYLDEDGHCIMEEMKLPESGKAGE